jgi:membrane protease subunit HflC
MGEADAEASGIYAAAYASSPRAAEFYAFTRTLETWRQTLDGDATLILTTDSELFRLLKRITPPPAGSAAPDAAPAPAAP